MAVNTFEIKRQSFHIAGGLIFTILIYYQLIGLIEIGILFIIGIILSLLSRKIKIPVLYWLLQQFEREENIKTFPLQGALFLVGGVFLALLMFPKDIALASIIILTLGDSVPIFVAHLGRIRHPFSNAKFLEAALLGMMAAFIGATFFVRPVEALVASFAAMVAEGIEMKLGMARVDDNIVMPVVAGLVIVLMRLL